MGYDRAGAQPLARTGPDRHARTWALAAGGGTANHLRLRRRPYRLHPRRGAGGGGSGRQFRGRPPGSGAVSSRPRGALRGPGSRRVLARLGDSVFPDHHRGVRSARARAPASDAIPLASCGYPDAAFGPAVSQALGRGAGCRSDGDEDLRRHAGIRRHGARAGYRSAPSRRGNDPRACDDRLGPPGSPAPASPSPPRSGRVPKRSAALVRQLRPFSALGPARGDRSNHTSDNRLIGVCWKCRAQKRGDPSFHGEAKYLTQKMFLSPPWGVGVEPRGLRPKAARLRLVVARRGRVDT